jgi:glycosyltransferase involved in cell wall biosynthesis
MLSTLPVTTVLHVLPHWGGGAETYIDVLAGMDGVEHVRMPVAASRTPIAAGPSIARGWPGIARRARSADLVHPHGEVAAALVLPLLRRHPSVWTTHGLHFLRRHPRAGLAVRAVVAATSITLCTSESERQELARVVGPVLSERLLLVRNGIDLPRAVTPAERAEARAALRLADEDLAALFLGELEPRKGPLVAVAATQAAREQGAPVVLLVAGDGSQAAEVSAAAGPGIRPLGFRDDVPVLLAAADVLVMPSVREGLSFAVLEAMGRGLAMLVSDGVGNPEAVGEAGVVVPVGDVEGFATALVRLARDTEHRLGLGAAARARVESELTADNLVEGVQSAYRAALGRPAA